MLKLILSLLALLVCCSEYVSIEQSIIKNDILQVVREVIEGLERHEQDNGGVRRHLLRWLMSSGLFWDLGEALFHCEIYTILRKTKSSGE